MFASIQSSPRCVARRRGTTTCINRQVCNKIIRPTSDASLTQSPFAPPPEATAQPAGQLCACHMGIWEHAPTHLRHQQPAHASPGACSGRRPRQRGQRGLDWRTKVVSGATARALDIIPASNMWSTVSRAAGEQSVAHPNLTLLHSLARMRVAWGTTNRRGAILPRRMRARGVAHLRAR